MNNGSAAIDKGHFANLAAESWWQVREELRQGQITLPDDPLLTAQLVGRKHKPRSDGKIILESKDEMKKRGLKSPDRADAVVLARWRPPFRAGPAVAMLSGPRKTSPFGAGARKI